MVGVGWGSVEWMKRAVLLPLVLAPLVLALACVTVTPAQRKHLSKPEMQPATDKEEETFHIHVEAAREGSFGGHGAAGGGCGCG
jgi:hypothetical protein